MPTIFRTVVFLLAVSASALTSPPATNSIERDCFAASARWGQLGCGISDLDGDHQPDYAFSPAEIGTTARPGILSIHLSGARSVYELSLPTDRPAQAFLLRDVNGDGYVDLVLIGGLNQTVGVYLNDGYGRLAFDLFDRYLTAPTTDSSRLFAPSAPRLQSCAVWSNLSQHAALSGKGRTDTLHDDDAGCSGAEPLALARFFDSPRCRAP